MPISPSTGRRRVAFTIDSVVPWGRTYDEYVHMFDLRPEDLSGSILDCAGGPACFNAEATEAGSTVISVDPLYAFSAGAIRGRIDATRDTVLKHAQANASAFVWDAIPDIAALGALRMSAMQRFLDDYESGRQAGRYIVGELPDLPEDLPHVDLALVSHLLFTYSSLLDVAFHCASLHSLCRVAREVRVFPLLNMDSQPSPHLETVCQSLAEHGCHVEQRAVPYEFQRGGNTMLVVRG